MQYTTNMENNRQTPNQSTLSPPNPEKELPPSSSKLHTFENGAVLSDSAECSQIGRNILQRGNIVDSVIATLFCNGLLTMQSMGIGGGFIMNIWLKNERKAYTLDAREVAPYHQSTEWDTNPKSRMQGPLSIAVPGEIRGYWELFKRFASLPWPELIQPTINICYEGFTMTKHMADFLNPQKKDVPHFREMFVNAESGEFHRVGSHIFPPKNLCQLYGMLAQNGGDSFYNGIIANLILDDLREIGSVIGKEDLLGYKVKWSESISVRVDDNIFYVPPPPSSGLIIPFLLNLLNEDILTISGNKTLFYHRIAEAFKFGYAERSKLRDPHFYNIDDVIRDLTSMDYATKTRVKIKNEKTFNNYDYYGESFQKFSDHGTSHISIIAPNGDAVSVSSSLNFYFGCGLWGKRTGIIFNSGIDDFSFINSSNYFDLPWSPWNLIEPQKRAVSSMAPIIVTDPEANIKIVIGAAGGSKIPSAIVLTLLRILWLNHTVKEAVDAPRIHHQLHPLILEYEFGVIEEVINGLEKLGHKTMRYKDRGSIVGVLWRNLNRIYANVDYRKGGDVCGF